jgi:hypothetical protein
MVAVGDFGIRERERMVRLAIWHGWVFNAEKQAREHGISDPVVVLIAGDALDVLPLKFDRSPRDRGMERLQRKAGCKRFTVGVVSYAALLRGNTAEGWHDDMEDMRRKGGTACVCINRTGQFLVAINPEHPRQERQSYLDAHFMAASKPGGDG